MNHSARSVSPKFLQCVAVVHDSHTTSTFTISWAYTLSVLPEWFHDISPVIDDILSLEKEIGQQDREASISLGSTSQGLQHRLTEQNVSSEEKDMIDSPLTNRGGARLCQLQGKGAGLVNVHTSPFEFHLASLLRLRLPTYACWPLINWLRNVSVANLRMTSDTIC